MKMPPLILSRPTGRFVALGAIATLFTFTEPVAWSQTVDPDLQAWANRCSPAPDPYFLMVANQFVTEAKSSEAGWWGSMAAVHFLCAPSQPAALLNVKGNSLNLTVSGTVTFTPSVGAQGDGASGYLDMGVAPASIGGGFALNSHSLLLYSVSDTSSPAGDAGSSSGGYTIGVRPHYGANVSIWSGNNASITIASGTTTGLHGFVRTDTTSGFVVESDTTTAFSSYPALGWPTTTMRYLRQGSSGYFSPNQLAFAFVGSGSLTPTQTGKINASCFKMLDTLSWKSQLEPEFVAYMNRCSDVSSWNTNFVVAANQFIAEAKDSGWWDHMAEIYFFCAPSKADALLNVKDTTLNLTTVGTVTQTPYTGIYGDGITGYLETGTSVAGIPNFSASSHSMFVFSQSDSPSLGGEFGATSGTNIVGIRVRDGVNCTTWSANSVALNHSVTTGIGLTGVVRTGTAGGVFVKDLTQTPFTQAAVGLPSGNVHFLRIGTSGYFSHNALAFAFVGDGGITPQQTTDMYNSCIEMLGPEGLDTLTPVDPPVPVLPPNAFARSSTSAVIPLPVPSGTFHIFRPAAPPPSDSFDFVGTAGNPHTGYNSGPITDANTRMWGASMTSTDTQVARWEGIGSDRAMIGGPKSNIKPNDTMGTIINSSGVTCRTEFTSYQKAIGSTLVKTAYSAGMRFRDDPDYFALTGTHWGWGDIAQEWGYNVDAWQAKWVVSQSDAIFTTDTDADTGDIVHRAYCADPAETDDFFPNDAASGIYKTSYDRVILGPGRLADCPMRAGFILDHEHQDNRGSALEVQYITELMTIAHAKHFQLGAFGDPACYGSGASSGWTLDNAQQLLNLFDFCNIIAPPNPAGGLEKYLNDQYTFFKGPLGLPVPDNKLCMQISCGPPGQETPLTDALFARNFMLSHGIPRCYVVPGNGTLGGALSRMPNQVIATFLDLPLQ